MTLFNNKYRIESTRLLHWDYRNAAAYFITICTKNREHYFGQITNSEMHLSEIGIIARNNWAAIPEHFPNIMLGTYVIMPNHIHGIITIETFNSDNLNTQAQSSETHTHVQTLHCNVFNKQNDKKSLHCNICGNIHNKKTSHCNASTKMSQISPKKGSVSTIIRSYKSACTKQINLTFPNITFARQPLFHEHIIRNATTYQNIENYIVNNPASWKNAVLYNK